jgi:hypothetical protein
MKRTTLAVLAAITVTPLIIQSADARHHHRHHRPAGDANGNVSCAHDTVRVQTAYGISVCVDPRHSAKFLAFFASLKARGCEVHSIVCQAYGHAPGSNHIGGGACDVDQRARNRTSACMYHAGDLIRAAGLYDGCSFRDCGHVEAMRGLGNYGTTRTYAARSHHRRHSRVVVAAAPVAQWNRP